MNYFYFELLIGILLLISLLFFINSNTIAISIFLLSLVFLVNCDILEYYNSWEIVIKGFCIIVGLITFNSFSKRDVKSSGILVIAIVLAATMLISCSNTLLIYICLEFQTLSLFVLIARKQNEVAKIEAALKYFVLSSLSSGIYLIGSALLFINNGTCEINILSGDLLSMEKIFIITALLFKLACAPFHMWAPDVYQGCDNKSLLIIGTLPKISVFSLLISISPNTRLLLLAAILSLLIGSIGALNQTRINKILAYSGILNMGFILVGILTNSYIGLEVAILYLIFYVISFSLFLLIIDSFQNKSISDLAGFSTHNTVLSVTLGLLILSIAGIPPFSGFLVKWLILEMAISYKFVLTSLLCVTCAIIAGVYYLRLLKITYFQNDKYYLVWKKVLLKEQNDENVRSITTSLLFFAISFIILCPHLAKELVHVALLSLS